MLIFELIGIWLYKGERVICFVVLFWTFFHFSNMASSTSCFTVSVEWNCRELDIKEQRLEQILKYLNNRCMVYYWALLYHDGSVDCEIVSDSGEKYQYYHMFVWYKNDPNLSSLRKLYFSNLPFMQYVRRTYLLKGEIAYPTVLHFLDVISRMVSLINSKHCFMKESSHLPVWIEEELTQYLWLWKVR